MAVRPISYTCRPIHRSNSIGRQPYTTAPAGKESNWIPTNANGAFEVLMRFYGPEKRFFDKAWKLPDIEKV